MSELYHYGILGQKWGVRRYQNPDGSLTEVGKLRYGYGVNKIKSGSTVRRISNIISKDDNPIGLYAYGKEDGESYRNTAHYLPSVNPTYGSNVKEAKEVQYKFTKDATIASGKRTIDDYMARYGQMTAKEFVNDFSMGVAYTSVHKLAEQYGDTPMSEVYKQTKDTREGMLFTHSFIHNTVVSPQSSVTGKNPENTKTIIQDFTDYYKDLGIDAIVDPEDYSAGFIDPMIVLNKDVIKRTGFRFIKV